MKRIQAQEFEADKSSPNVRILQIDFAMAHECQYQNEVQSALWSRGSVNLFTAASIYDITAQSFLITTESKHKDKTSISVLEHIL